jgi:phage gpG-like protein
MVGFGQPYAAYHEFGTKKMIRRGTLFADPKKGELAPDDEKVILDAVLEHLKKAI